MLSVFLLITRLPEVGFGWNLVEMNPWRFPELPAQSRTFNSEQKPSKHQIFKRKKVMWFFLYIVITCSFPRVLLLLLLVSYLPFVGRRTLSLVSAYYPGHTALSLLDGLQTPFLKGFGGCPDYFFKRVWRVADQVQGASSLCALTVGKLRSHWSSR